MQMFNNREKNTQATQNIVTCESRQYGGKRFVLQQSSTVLVPACSRQEGFELAE
eukprot:m.156632 g.156632  ORF g.156632 m.156632 type:complete len:54 (-) comp20835_c0_seq1:1189-1350(-)